jgi:cellulose synthase operon protein C
MAAPLAPWQKPWLALAAFALLAGPPAPAEEAKPDPEATRQYAVASGLQARKLYARAARRWQQFIDSYPKDPRLANAYHHLGACQLHDRQPAKAAETFRTLIEKFPRSETRDAAHFNLGLALYHVGLTSKKPDDLRSAARAFAEVPERFPRSKHAAPALYYQGESLYRAGDLPGAVALYRKVIAGHPGSDLLPDAYYALGTAQQELARDREAESTFRAFLDKFPKDKLAGECRVRLGMSLTAQKRHAEAAKLFEQAASLPGFPLADFALMQQARCAHEQKQLARAADLYESLPKKFPASARAGPALLAAGKCWYQSGDFARAESALSAALDRKFAEAPEAAYWLGLALLKRDRPAEAVRVLDRAIASHPRSTFLPQLAFTRINALYEQPGRRKETAALYADFARKYAPDELAPRALYMASLAALGGRDYLASRRHAEEFLKRFPRHELTPEVLFIGAEAYLATDPPQPARAEELYRRLLAEHPRHRHAPRARLGVGTCLYRAKKYPAAVAYLTESIKELRDPALAAEAFLLIGRSHHDAGHPAEAVASLRKALEARPGWERGDEVLLALARALHAQKKPDEATAQLKRLQGDYPKSPLQAHALYHLGEIAQERKKYDDAVGLYERAAARSPGSEPAFLARYAVGTVCLTRRDYARAVEAFGKLLDSHPPGPLGARARYKRAVAYHKLGQFEPAARDLTAFLASRPPAKDALDARYTLALCQSALKQHALAADTFSALLREKPDYERAAQVYYEMGHCLLLAKKDKEAAGAFRQLAEKSPDSPLAAEAWFRVGEFHESSRELRQAARAYSAGLRKAKDAGLREKLHYRLGWVRYRRDQFAEAAEAFLAQLEERPRGELAADATYLAGDCLFRQDQFAKARPLFERLIRARDRKYHARALYRCGACHAGLKEWGASQRCFEELIRQFPKFKLLQEARYGLGWALQNQDKLDEARRVYERVTKATATETAARSRFMIGECAFRRKKYEEAVEHFLEAALAYPYPEWQALGYFEAGRCFIALKDTPKALDALGTVVKKFPKHARAKDAAKLIADLKKGGR